MCVKFHDPSLNRSRELPHEAVGGSILTVFPRNFQPEVATDVISGVALDSVCMDVCIKLGDSIGQTAFNIFEELISCPTNERTDRGLSQ